MAIVVVVRNHVLVRFSWFTSVLAGHRALDTCRACSPFFKTRSGDCCAGRFIPEMDDPLRTPTCV
jgi:hypothetical protein